MVCVTMQSDRGQAVKQRRNLRVDCLVLIACNKKLRFSIPQHIAAVSDFKTRLNQLMIALVGDFDHLVEPLAFLCGERS